MQGIRHRIGWRKFEAARLLQGFGRWHFQQPRLYFLESDISNLHNITKYLCWELNSGVSFCHHRVGSLYFQLVCEVLPNKIPILDHTRKRKARFYLEWWRLYYFPVMCCRRFSISSLSTRSFSILESFRVKKIWYKGTWDKVKNPDLSETLKESLRYNFCSRYRESHVGSSMGHSEVNASIIDGRFQIVKLSVVPNNRNDACMRIMSDTDR